MAEGHGGGISNTGQDATVDAFHVTIAENTIEDDGDGDHDGGGVFDGTESFFLANSIVANNVDTGGEAPDYSGAVNTNGFNLIENTNGTIFPGTGDITGVEPLSGINGSIGSATGAGATG